MLDGCVPDPDREVTVQRNSCRCNAAPSKKEVF